MSATDYFEIKEEPVQSDLMESVTKHTTNLDAKSTVPDAEVPIPDVEELPFLSNTILNDMLIVSPPENYFHSVCNMKCYLVVTSLPIIRTTSLLHTSLLHIFLLRCAQWLPTAIVCSEF